MHLWYLNKYSHIFDKAIFVISLKENDEELIIDTKINILKNLHVNDVEFKVIKDNDLHESGAFKTEVIDKLDSIDGLVFCAHTKGISNFGKYNEESIKLWISSLWYYNLEHVYDVVNELVYHERKALYGAYLLDDRIDKIVKFNKNNCWYAGNFYWINAGKLKYDIDNINNSMLTRCYSKYFFEKFPGEVYNIEKLGSFENKSVRTSKFHTYFCKIEDVVNYFGDNEKFKEQFYFMKNELCI